MKKIFFTCALVLAFASNITHAQQPSPLPLADGVKIFEKAVKKTLMNAKGEMAPGDTAKEVFGFKRNIFNMYIETKLDTAIQSTSTALKIYATTDYKTNQKTKTRIESSGVSFTPIINNTEKDAILIRSIDKYVRGLPTETYIATDVGEEKVYRVWKINAITNMFKAILANRNVPTNLSNTIINKIISKKYLKITSAELKKGLWASLGLKSSNSTAVVSTEAAVRESNRLNADYAGILQVKEYLGIVDYDDVELLANNKQKVTTTKLHTLVLAVDTDKLTQYVINNKKVSKYTFGVLDEGASLTDVTVAMQNLYKNLELLVWVDAVTYEIKAFEVSPYEISYTDGPNKLSVTLALSSVEGLTTSTGYIEPVPSKFITLKDIRNMFLKY